MDPDESQWIILDIGVSCWIPLDPDASRWIPMIQMNPDRSQLIPKDSDG